MMHIYISGAAGQDQAFEDNWTNFLCQFYLAQFCYIWMYKWWPNLAVIATSDNLH